MNSHLTQYPSYSIRVLSFSIRTKAVEDTGRVDYMMYRIPNTDSGMMLEGKAKVNTGETVTLKHPRGNLHFSTHDVQIFRTPTREAVYGRQARGLRGANANVDETLKVAKWALHHGMLDKCKALLGDAWKIDPSHQQLRKLAGLMRYLNRPVSTNNELEEHAKEFVGGRSMTTSRSKHFLLLHDGDGKKDPITKKTRAQMRLELLETVYESYFGVRL